MSHLLCDNKSYYALKWQNQKCELADLHSCLYRLLIYRLRITDLLSYLPPLHSIMMGSGNCKLDAMHDGYHVHDLKI